MLQISFSSKKWSPDILSRTMRDMTYRFPVVITQGKDGLYTAHVPTLRGCHTQAKSLPVLHKRLQEAMELCLEVERSKRQPIPQDVVIAMEQIEIAI